MFGLAKYKLSYWFIKIKWVLHYVSYIYIYTYINLCKEKDTAILLAGLFAKPTTERVKWKDNQPTPPRE